MTPSTAMLLGHATATLPAAIAVDICAGVGVLRRGNGLRFGGVRVPVNTTLVFMVDVLSDTPRT